jgi:hypothetical protein
MEHGSIYSEARNEYLKQLSTWIVPPLVEFFRNQYERISRAEGRSAMRAFQNFCAEVPRWNQDIITENINTILDNCRCDYVEELMTAVFIAHTKMLTAIRVSTKQKKLSITLPKLDHFLHRVFVECARSFWKAPFLFADDLSHIERQKNVLQAESMCTEAVSGAVRSLLPVKNILRDYLDEEDSEEEAAPVESKKKKSAPVAEPDSSSSDEEEEEAVPAATPAITASSSASEAPPLIPVTTTAPFAASESATAVEAEELVSPSPEPVAEAPAPIVIEKLDTPPEPPKATESNHEITAADVKASDIKIEKMDTEAPAVDPPKLLIDTEPAVHFTPYDTVFDENKPGVSEIRYAEKVSVEDKPPSNWGIFDDDDDEKVPRLQIGGSSSSLGLDDVEDVDGPAAAPLTSNNIVEDVDAPLGLTDDFESIE